MTQNEEGLRIGDTSTGLGVFATRPFSANEFVGDVHGKIINDLGYDSEYCIELSECVVLEPDTPFRFLNHSCGPNCALYWAETEIDEFGFSSSQIWVETIAEIAPGEQLTIDYSWPADVAIPCKCGSQNCRGWVVSEEEMNEVQLKTDGQKDFTPTQNDVFSPNIGRNSS